MTDRARRTFLVRCAGAAAGAALPPGFAAARARWPALLGAWEQDGVHHAGVWTAEHGARGVPLPFRPHGVLADPLDAGQCIVIARRPGGALMRIDARRQHAIALVDAEPERVLNGHGALSADGRTLYTAESGVIDGAGWIGVRDAATLETRAAFATGGIGPHALLLEPDGSLLVANGGILTLPDTGRAKLAIERMDPSLVRLDARGRLLGQWRLADPRLSIRHLARAPNGRIGIALQAEHAQADERDAASLFAWFDGASLHLADKPPGVGLGGYGGDMACVAAADGAMLFAVSCTRAGVVAWWDEGGRWLGTSPMEKAGALVPFGATLIAAGGNGGLARIARPGLQPETYAAAALEWDNHMAVVSAPHRNARSSLAPD